MKKFLLIFFSSVFGLIFSFWLFRAIYNKIELRKEKAVTYILSEKEKALIEDGDIILRYGHGLVSDYIVNSFNEKYSISHCGIINKKENGKLEIIHSESSSFLVEDGIQRQDFDGFTDAGHKNSVVIVRFNKCEKNELKKITKRAQYYLNQNIPFAYTCQPEDTTRMFCSEIIWHVFQDVFGVDIFAVNGKERDFNQFKNFYDSSQFDIVLNHQINVKF
ncbi:MAG: hypothetical protein L3J35_09340 [Bacteroidales bacterium]|nr:hypothetical protein [Bacteroidales bacterium]